MRAACEYTLGSSLRRRIVGLSENSVSQAAIDEAQSALASIHGVIAEQISIESLQDLSSGIRWTSGNVEQVLHPGAFTRYLQPVLGVEYNPPFRAVLSSASLAGNITLVGLDDQARTLKIQPGVVYMFGGKKINSSGTTVMASDLTLCW